MYHIKLIIFIVQYFIQYLALSVNFNQLFENVLQNNALLQGVKCKLETAFVTFYETFIQNFKQLGQVIFL